jgi:hypothetical protein
MVKALKRWLGTARRLDETNAKLDALDAKLNGLDTRLGSADEATQQIGSGIRDELDRIVQILQAISDDERDNRRRLGDLRGDAEYELAYTEYEPLVSVIVPTYDNHTGLRERGIPSVLAQTYRNFELLVVGDRAPEETGRVVAQFADQRIRYKNLSVRGPYPEDRHQRWLMAGSAPFNAALPLAGGRWLAPFADDDAMRPDALETMVATVKRERHELCYGLLCVHGEDDSESLLGEFPPALHRFGMQGGIYHSGLRFFDHRLSNYLFGLPNDWATTRSMMQAGVRMGFVEQVVCDYYPSYRGREESGSDRPSQ